MINNDNDNKILKDAFDAELMKRLESNPPEILSYEEFSAMADSQLNKRRRKNRIIGIAASLAIVLLASIFAATQLTPDVDADKNPKEEIITEDGVIIEDGGWGSSEDEDNVWVIEEWEHVYDAKKEYNGVLIPKYIPDGYIFEEMTLEILESGVITAEYLFEKQNIKKIEIELFIAEEGVSSVSIDQGKRIARSSKGHIYISDQNKIATIQLDNGVLINIWSDMSDEEIIKVIDNLY